MIFVRLGLTRPLPAPVEAFIPQFRRSLVIMLDDNHDDGELLSDQSTHFYLTDQTTSPWESQWDTSLTIEKNGGSRDGYALSLSGS